MISVVVIDEQHAHPLEAARFGSLAEKCLLDRSVSEGELNLTFVTIATITDLNLEHMGASGPTDVLSFPIDAGLAVDSVGPGPTLLGDIVICPEMADRQAGERGVSIEDEVALLVVHAVLHILGLDHADPVEASQMQAVERELLARYHS